MLACDAVATEGEIGGGVLLDRKLCLKVVEQSESWSELALFLVSEPFSGSGSGGSSIKVGKNKNANSVRECQYQTCNS